jgi:hypothetical protein
VLVLGRTLVDGSEDLPSAHDLMDRYRLTPLSAWGRQRTTVPSRRDVYVPVPAAEDMLAPWRTLNAMLAENPPPAHHGLILDQLARIGIGAGCDVDAQPAAVKQGLGRAAAMGMGLLRQQFTSGDWATKVNGWRYPPPEEGRFGDNFLGRAADQSLAGIAANDPAEAVYLLNFEDANGSVLAPDGRYQLRFSAAELPPVDAFWSVSAYTAADMNLIANSAGRYSVGDRTPGLSRDSDGGIALHLQPEPPGKGADANWMQTSGDSPWFVILRLYRPQGAVLDGSWRCPPITRVA